MDGLDRFESRILDAIEWSLAAPQHHGHEIQNEFIDRSRCERLPHCGRTPGDVDAFIACGGSCQLEGDVETAGNEVEPRPALPSAPVKAPASFRLGAR